MPAKQVNKWQYVKRWEECWMPAKMVALVNSYQLKWNFVVSVSTMNTTQRISMWENKSTASKYLLRSFSVVFFFVAVCKHENCSCWDLIWCIHMLNRILDWRRVIIFSFSLCGCCSVVFFFFSSSQLSILL